MLDEDLCPNSTGIIVGFVFSSGDIHPAEKGRQTSKRSWLPVTPSALVRGSSCPVFADELGTDILPKSKQMYLPERSR